MGALFEISGPMRKEEIRLGEAITSLLTHTSDMRKPAISYLHAPGSTTERECRPYALLAQSRSEAAVYLNIEQAL